MSQNVQIDSSGPSITDAMRATILAQVDKLQKSTGPSHGLHSCHVHVSQPTGGSALPHLYNIRLRITIDDKELVANDHEHPDFYVAVRHAFEVLHRQIRAFRETRSANLTRDKTISSHLDTEA